MRVWSTELKEHVGERVELQGWLLNHRPLSRVDFVILRDGKGVCQIVVNDEAERAEVAKWFDETVFTVEGTPKLNEQAPGGVELVDPTFTLVAATPEPPPVNLRVPELKEQLPFQLDHAAVSLRHPRRRAVFRLGALSLAGHPRDARRRRLRRDPDAEDRRVRHRDAAPTSSRIDYFGRPGYLAQSPQFYKQMMVGVFERVYEIGPVFRAEPHDTVRHLAEYVSLDVELGFIDDHLTSWPCCRDLLAGMVAAMQERRRARARAARPHAARRARRRSRTSTSSTRRSSSSGETGEKACVGEPDLAPAHERCARRVGRCASTAPTSCSSSATRWSKRPFYTHPNPERPEYSNSFDLIFRGLELVTGGQRLHRYDDYVAVLERARPGSRAATRRTSRRSSTACRRTAGSRSAGSAGWRGCRGEQRPRDDALPARHQPHPAVITIDFAGRVVLVTGGSRGIGRGIAAAVRGRRRARRRLRPHRARRAARGLASSSRPMSATPTRSTRVDRRRSPNASRASRRARQQRRRRAAVRHRHRVAAVHRRDHRVEPHRAARVRAEGERGDAGAGRRRRDREHRERERHPTVAEHRRVRRGEGRAC